MQGECCKLIPVFVNHDQFSRLTNGESAYENGVAKVICLILEPVDQIKPVTHIQIRMSGTVQNFTVVFASVLF